MIDMKYGVVLGRGSYGGAIVIMGLLTLIYGEWPYMLLPSEVSKSALGEFLVYPGGVLLLIAGLGIALGYRVIGCASMLAVFFVLAFCFAHIPWLWMSRQYLNFGAWENGFKALTLGGGALILTEWHKKSDQHQMPDSRFRKASLGVILFSIPIMSFGANHFLMIQGVVAYTPSWVPFRLFWAYFTGIALLGAGSMILIGKRVGLVSLWLGIMIMLWVVMLHIPRVISSPPEYMSGEITSMCLAWAYCGIALIISGTSRGHGNM